MPAINPWVWKSVVGIVTAPFIGHFALVASIAVGSAITNYYLTKNGHLIMAKVLNKVSWASGIIVFFDVFFDALMGVKGMFHL